MPSDLTPAQRRALMSMEPGRWYACGDLQLTVSEGADLMIRGLVERNNAGNRRITPAGIALRERLTREEERDGD